MTSDPTSPISWRPFQIQCPCHPNSVVGLCRRFSEFNSTYLFRCNDRSSKPSHLLLFDLATKELFPLLTAELPPVYYSTVVAPRIASWNQPAFSPKPWKCEQCQHENSDSSPDGRVQCINCNFSFSIVIGYDVFVCGISDNRPSHIMRIKELDRPVWYSHPFVVIPMDDCLRMFDCSDSMNPREVRVFTARVIAFAGRGNHVVQQFHTKGEYDMGLECLRLPTLTGPKIITDTPNDRAELRMFEIFHDLFLVGIFCDTPFEVGKALGFGWIDHLPSQIIIKVFSLVNGTLMNEFAICLPERKERLPPWVTPFPVAWCGEYLIVPADSNSVIPLRLQL